MDCEGSEMKRYLLFQSSTYYSAGGWDDFIGQFDSAEDARDEAIKLDPESVLWYQVIDTLTLKEVSI